MAEWNVYYNNDFGSETEEKQPGREVSVNKKITWQNEQWEILSIYLCGEGIVVDVCQRVDPTAINKYREKWSPFQDHIQEMPEEQLEQMMQESPFITEFRLLSEINGVPLEEQGRSIENWNPGYSQETSVEAILDHYGLDKLFGWVIHRAAYAWKEKTEQDLQEVRLVFAAEPENLFGSHFIAEEAGQQIDFIHPVTNQKHTLKITSIKSHLLDKDFPDDGWEYPRNVLMLSYTVIPALSDGSFFISDCSKGDAPRLKKKVSDSPYPVQYFNIGFVRYGDDSEIEREVPPFGIGSSIYFDPPERVEWRMKFCEKLQEDMTVTLQAGRDFDIIKSDCFVKQNLE